MYDRDSSILGGLYTSFVTEKYYNNELSPQFWHNNKFDEEVREKLLQIAKDFYNHLKLDVPVLDIQLTGSLANYNYSVLSDLDVHIIIDFSKINKDVELVKKALDGARFVWNMRHNIIINNHDVELYVQDVNEQHVSSGLYSLLHDEWIKKPHYDPPEIDERDVSLKFQQYVKEIDRMEEQVDKDNLSNDEYLAISKRAEKLKDKIQKDRKECLAREGEFCVENLVFKALRNTDYIEKIIDIAAKAYDKQFAS